MLAHPRFRAAFDFLVLRQSASDEHAEEVAFWREAQVAQGDGLALEADPVVDAGLDEAAPRRRRRRRRGASSASA
jgi:poly(A) polymerase